MTHGQRLTLARHVQDAFIEDISFAVLRLLVDACKAFQERTCSEGETIFVSSIVNAVKHVCDEDHFLSLSRRDSHTARQWGEDLSSLHRRMQQVRDQQAAFGNLRAASLQSLRRS